ncbi:hypothetical protein AA0311_0649 [Asaia bogorensis NBRC 16594]|nr:hypothetical protein AA0311_0649 [Asaia bogorensis NBRC 16594]
MLAEVALERQLVCKSLPGRGTGQIDLGSWCEPDMGVVAMSPRCRGALLGNLAALVLMIPVTDRIDGVSVTAGGQGHRERRHACHDKAFVQPACFLHFF